MMGAIQSVDYDRFPAQSEYVGREVVVCFNYDSSRVLPGRIVRDDTEAPGLMLIQLNDGRIITSTECQYNIPRLDAKPLETTRRL